ncbi:hypothetical protein BLTE_25480 [Blastochloris tepida]|uniref:Uncharacterized protein n=1 Tax=Blastochloris tepida TaxID=2233851 RepID=A0A348G2T0_9HYPH|nr:hypothetical protein BLTE_25480 [Blastochloris tepida]
MRAASAKREVPHKAAHAGGILIDAAMEREIGSRYLITSLFPWINFRPQNFCAEPADVVWQARWHAARPKRARPETQNGPSGPFASA